MNRNRREADVVQRKRALDPKQRSAKVPTTVTPPSDDTMLRIDGADASLDAEADFLTSAVTR